MGLIGALDCPVISRLAPPNEVTMRYVSSGLRALERLSHHHDVVKGYYDTLKEKLEVVGNRAMY